MASMREIRARIADAIGNIAALVATETGHALAVYQTNKEKGGYIHLHVNDLAIGTYRVILIDISDTVNYNHDDAGYAHIEAKRVSVVSDTGNTEWELTLGFLDEVDATGSKVYPFYHSSGSKDTGNNLNENIVKFPVGPHLHKNFLTVAPPAATGNFQSDVLVNSTLSPATPDVYPGDGDVVLEIVITGGPVRELSIDIAYHSHSNPT